MQPSKDFLNTSNGKNSRIILFVLALVVSFNQTNSLASDAVEKYDDQLISPISRQIRFNFIIVNPTKKELINQTVWFYAPVKRTSTQQVVKIDVTMPFEIEEDDLGNQIIKLFFSHLSAYGTKIVNVKVDLLMSSFSGRSQLKRADIFMGEERYIEKDDPLVQHVAQRIAAGDPAATAYAVYRWVAENMHYSGYVADDLGARYAIINTQGDCTEYAFLVTALARANMIPARPLGGYVVAVNSSPKATDYHNWAEVYIDGTWRLLDAQKRNYQTNVENYVVTEVISERILNSMKNSHRFRVDGDISVRMN